MVRKQKIFAAACNGMHSEGLSALSRVGSPGLEGGGGSPGWRGRKALV